MASDPRTICIAGVPIDLGAGRRGVDMGPSAIRVAGLADELAALGHTIEDGGDVTVRIPETESVGRNDLRFKGPILDACTRVMQMVTAAHARAGVPLVLGGDHSLSIGSVAGTARYFAARGERIGVIWLDAHGDFNTPETTPSGNIHGMSLAVCAGLGEADLVNLGGEAPMVQPENIVVVSARDLDEGERNNLRRSGVSVYTMRRIDELGMRRVMEEAIALASRGTAGVHVSLDLDAVDPEFAPGTGTPVMGGISYREAHLAMEMIGDQATLVSMDVVEVNPVLDFHNRTAELAVELVASAMGKRIL